MQSVVLVVALALWVGNIPPVLMAVIELPPVRPWPGRSPWAWL